MVAAYCPATATWEAVVIAGGRVVGYGSSPDYGVAVEAAVFEARAHGVEATLPPRPRSGFGWFLDWLREVMG